MCAYDRPPSRSTWRSGPDHESPDVRANLRRILLLSHAARCNADYEFLDKYSAFPCLLAGCTDN